MAKKLKIKKCKTCGALLNPKDRLKRILKEADESLERHYNKLRKKNK